MVGCRQNAGNTRVAGGCTRRQGARRPQERRKGRKKKQPVRINNGG